jgi:hypothetical protein
MRPSLSCERFHVRIVSGTKRRDHEMISQRYKSQWGNSPQDRRRSARYPLAGAAWFQWKEAGGARHAASGVTRDIGKGGVFVECESLPVAASAIELDVTLAINWNQDAFVRLRGVGDVRHVHLGDCARNGYGAAVVFHMETPATEQNRAEERRYRPE